MKGKGAGDVQGTLRQSGVFVSINLMNFRNLVYSFALSSVLGIGLIFGGILNDRETF